MDAAPPPAPSPAPAALAIEAGPSEVRVVLVTAPPDQAHTLARALVERGLAACVNLVPGLRSLYRWRGALHDDPESLLLIKTLAPRLGELRVALADLHPYELPELLALAPQEGSPPYLAWLREALAPPAGPHEP